MNPWPHESTPGTAMQGGATHSMTGLGNTKLGTSARSTAPQHKTRKDSPAEIESKWARHERRNYQAARIILANPQRYSGLPLEWAKFFLAAHRPAI